VAVGVECLRCCGVPEPCLHDLDGFSVWWMEDDEVSWGRYHPRTLPQRDDAAPIVSLTEEIDRAIGRSLELQRHVDAAIRAAD